MAVPDYLRGRRGAFLALGAAVVLALIVIGLPIAMLFASQASDIDDSEHQIAAYQAEVGQRPQLQARLEALRQSAQSVPGLLTGSNAALAQAQLQSDMKELIERNGGTLLSAQLLPPTHSNGFDVASISYDMTVPLGHFRAMLYSVETHTPFYFVNDADFIMPPNWRPGNAQNPDPAMEVRFTIHAYRWSGRR
ncbi:MAG: type II secretion system protein GspM [Rhizomicrobium sp.]|jgi:hypothetical protein